MVGAGIKEHLVIAGPLDKESLGPLLKRARFMCGLPGETSGDEARLADLADFLPREEAREVLRLAGLQDLMWHYRPALTSTAWSSMYS